MEAVIEKECSALGGLFQTLIGDMKSSCPIWEDFINKAGKLQSQLRATAVAVAAFLDAFQKVADLATNSRGGTRDIGSALTRMCMRHRSIEAKLKQFSMGFLEGLISPLQEQMEEWKRGVNTLDKDHAKEYKKARQEIKKKSSDTLKLQKKAKKGRGDFQPQLDSAMQDVSDKYILLEETEKQAIRKALIEERQRFCYFVAVLRPVVDEEISMLGELTHLQTISEDLKALTSDPHKLPPACEQVIMDLKASDYSWLCHTPPSSPSTTMSRKSSMCSSLNSVNSSESRGSSGSHSHSPSSSSSSSSSHHLFQNHHPRHRYRSSTLPQQAPPRLCSISSHDSGFVSSSQDQNASSKSSSPLTAESKLSNGFDHYSPAGSPYHYANGASMGSLTGATFPFFPSSSSSTSSPTRSWSRPASALLPDHPPFCTLGSPMFPSSRVPSWKDWAKPGPYDQPMVNTLRRRKDRDTPSVVVSNGSVSSGNSWSAGQTSTSAPTSAGPLTATQLEEKNGITPAAPKSAESQAHNELAIALSRGLELDMQMSSRDSIQCSSGYSTQTNTPCCSEDTIPSQVSDCDYFSMAGDQETEQQQQQQQQQQTQQLPADFDKSSTIPRNSDVSQSYRRMFQSKRPASTAGLPVTQTPYTGQGSCYVGPHPSTPIHTGVYHSGYPSTPTGHGPVIVTPGVATIRRTPSKPSARRSGSVGGGPIPIRTPVIPVKTPTVPDVSQAVNGIRDVEEVGREVGTEFSTLSGPKGTISPTVAAWGSKPSSSPQTGLPSSQLQSEEVESENEVGEPGSGNMLVAIRQGVKLKRTHTNDRSAPRIA